MLKAPIELVDGVESVLQDLSDRYDLFLITKGDFHEQGRKIERSGLSRVFRFIEVVPDKTGEVYRRLLRTHQIPPSRFIMVGNSLRSDILPVIEIGGQAIFIPNKNTWFHEEVPETEIIHDAFTTLDNLTEIPEFIEGLHK